MQNVKVLKLNIMELVINHVMENVHHLKNQFVEKMVKTYRNRCVLRSNLVEIKYNGECKSKIVKDPKDIKKKS